VAPAQLRGSGVIVETAGTVETVKTGRNGGENSTNSRTVGTLITVGTVGTAGTVGQWGQGGQGLTVHSQPFVEVLPRRQPHGLPQVPTPEGRIDVFPQLLAL